jgi:hypothetical protein
MYSELFFALALIGVTHTPDHYMKWQALVVLVIFLEYMMSS